MRIFTHTIWIARTPEAVFDFFLDFGQAPRWRQYVRSMRTLDDASPRAGSRIQVEMDLMGESRRFEMEVLECRRPTRWRHRTDEHDFNGDIDYAFAAEGGGTRVTMSGRARPISLYGWLGMPLLLLSRGRAYAEQLPRLKRVMEEE